MERSNSDANIALIRADSADSNRPRPALHLAEADDARAARGRLVHRVGRRGVGCEAGELRPVGHVAAVGAAGAQGVGARARVGRRHVEVEVGFGVVEADAEEVGGGGAVDDGVG